MLFDETNPNNMTGRDKVYCGQCRTQNQVSNKFCFNCGEQLNKTSQSEILEDNSSDQEKKVIPELQPNLSYTKIAPSKRLLGYYLIWVCAHLLIFLITKIDTDVIQLGSGDVDAFWPFTSFHASKEGAGHGMTYSCEERNGEPCFYGIFADYDFSEFLIYSFIPIIFYLIKKLLKGEQAPQ